MNRAIIESVIDNGDPFAAPARENHYREIAELKRLLSQAVADLVRAENKLRALDAATLRQPLYCARWYDDAREQANRDYGKPDPIAYRARHV